MSESLSIGTTIPVVGDAQVLKLALSRYGTESNLADLIIKKFAIGYVYQLGSIKGALLYATYP